MSRQKPSACIPCKQLGKLVLAVPERFLFCAECFQDTNDLFEDYAPMAGTPCCRYCMNVRHLTTEALYDPCLRRYLPSCSVSGTHMEYAKVNGYQTPAWVMS